MAPNDLVNLLGEYLREMSDLIAGHQGVVDKYIGDSIMALWGTPHPLTNHALFACHTALKMKAALSKLWVKWTFENKPKLTQRIGIDTGSALVGNIGSPSRMDYTALGDTINLGSRLEGLNKFYGTQILIGEKTAAAVKEELLVRPIDWVAVKGKKVSSLIYELIDRSSDATNAIKEAAAVYTSALENYKKRAFAEAIELFSKADQLFGGNDQPSKLLKERSEQFLKEPPPAGWLGFTIFDKK